MSKKTITFDINKPIEESKKEINDLIDEVYAEEKRFCVACDDFIKTLFKLIRLSFDLTEKDAEYLDNYEMDLLASDFERKQLFAASYSVELDGAMEDVVELAREHEKFNKSPKKEKSSLKKQFKNSKD